MLVNKVVGQNTGSVIVSYGRVWTKLRICENESVTILALTQVPDRNLIYSYDKLGLLNYGCSSCIVRCSPPKRLF